MKGSSAGSSTDSPGDPFDHRRLDELLHSRIRLAAVAVLAAVRDAEFTYLRDRVRTSDGNLSGHLRKLEEAGYVEVEKRFVDRKPVTRYRLTETGREALARYVDHLETMLDPEESEEPEASMEPRER